MLAVHDKGLNKFYINGKLIGKMAANDPMNSTMDLVIGEDSLGWLNNNLALLNFKWVGKIY